MLSNQLIAYIRTYVPMGVGAVLSYLALNFGFEVDTDTAVALGAGLGGLLAGAYYFAANMLAKKWPWFQWLLGYPSAPTYSPPS